ncbi:XRN 5'-3' exonuclease N-terminus-domain-containing protein [Globomyces pollinis-pini]|nr:XRN 5'-3' exonuclease N-terminus-domain-containing protein [Globomyces pollinis-pini]
MGIPSLFRWLSNKYPKVISQVIEELPRTINDQSIPVDASQKNPNGLEIDNLYLDMNGIIHPCCHPEDKPAPATEEEMFIEIFKYIDRIFAMIRPRKILYMAIDGVAPRAKMNQQRSRRFRAAREEEIKMRTEVRARLEAGLPLEDKKAHFDSNCITPGTPFMDQLAICLRYYITDRLNNDPGWKGVKVLLSDASVPGEGEHKIMDFIRRQRTLATYDQSTHHVIYGLDADLIMLALATHEPNFWILREEVVDKRQQKRACELCGQFGHSTHQCTGKAKVKTGEWDDQTRLLELKPFVFVHISILREYLEAEMMIRDLPFKWDLERAIDDWVFMCFFVGNDFLPHLPSLEIREGAVELLIGIWKANAKNWGGYLTNAGDIDLARVEIVLQELGQVEDVTFQKRRQEEEQRRLNRLDRKKREKEIKKHGHPVKKIQTAKPSRAVLNAKLALIEQMKELDPLPVKGVSKEVRAKRNYENVVSSKPVGFSHKHPNTSETNKAAAKKLKLALLAKKPIEDPKVGFSITDFQAETTTAVPIDAAESEEEIEEEIDGAVVVPTPGANDIEPKPLSELFEEDDAVDSEGIVHEIPEEKADSDAEAPHDEVRLWESGWKTRYYETKFQVDVGDQEFRKTVVQSYVEGLCWVLKYYYQGVQSWKWYYPFHYSPFASDFTGMADLKIEFDKSEPFKPIEQLLGVFPAHSKSHIPQVFHYLMTDQDSPIIDFYPVDFPIDLNGKKYEWQGVALLPFIDADRLLEAVRPLYPSIDVEERRRNTLGYEILFAESSQPIFDSFCALYGNSKISKPVMLDTSLSGRLGGSVFKDQDVCLPGSIYPSPLLEFNLEDIPNESAISVVYYMPNVSSKFQFKATLLPNAIMPPKVLNRDDLTEIRTNRSNAFFRGRRGVETPRGLRFSFAPSNNSSFHSRSGRGGGQERYERRPRNDNDPRDDNPQSRSYGNNSPNRGAYNNSNDGHRNYASNRGSSSNDGYRNYPSNQGYNNPREYRGPTNDYDNANGNSRYQSRPPHHQGRGNSNGSGYRNSYNGGHSSNGAGYTPPNMHGVRAPGGYGSAYPPQPQVAALQVANLLSQLQPTSAPQSHYGQQTYGQIRPGVYGQMRPPGTYGQTSYPPPNQSSGNRGGYSQQNYSGNNSRYNNQGNYGRRS